MSSRILVLLNPESGSLHKHARLLDEVLAHEALEGADVRMICEPDELTRVAAAAREAGDTWVLAGGGDGTIHAVVNGLLRDGAAGSEALPRLGVLPLGTANDFARTLGVHDLAEALEAIAVARRGPDRRAGGSGARLVASDLIRVSFDGGRPEYVTNICVAGFGGDVQEEVTPEIKEDWGPLAYVRGGVGVYEGDGYPATLEIDGQGPRETRFFNLAASNGRYSGGGIPIAPRAQVDDGRMDMVIIEPIHLAGLAALAPLIARGRHLDSEHVSYETVARLRISSAEPMHYSLDGDAWTGRVVDVEVVEGALRMAAVTDADEGG
jgi:diacylglycerol kinase (ATP)